MAANIEKELFSFINALGAKVSFAFLKERLYTHPDFPSLLSITDTLDELDVPNTALVVEKTRLREISVPFIVHSSGEHGGFSLVKNVDDFLARNPGFTNSWEGVVLVAEKPKGPPRGSHAAMLAKERKAMQLNLLLIALLLLASGASQLHSFTITGALLLLSTIAGTGIAVLIIQKELGYRNALTEQLCGESEQTDCNAVIHSKGSRLFSWLNLSDMGIIYFSACWMMLVVSSFSKLSVYLPFAFMAAAAVPVTFFSLYYQWRLVKKWCRLCLITVAVLWVQFGLLYLPAGRQLWQGISTDSVLFAGLMFFIPAAAWLALIKPELFNLKEAREKNLPLTRFSRDPDLFVAMLKKEHRVDPSPMEYDFQLGNPHAALQIIMISNTYCGPCQAAHRLLHNLLENHHNNIGVTIRFVTRGYRKDDSRVRVVTHLLQKSMEATQALSGIEKSALHRELIDDWYSTIDVDTFIQKHPLNGVSRADMDEVLLRYENWISSTGISGTPSFFINGYKLPRKYTLSDFFALAPYLQDAITPAEYNLTT